MPIEIREQTDGRILVIHVKGKLVKEDYGQFVRESDRLVKERGPLRVLFRSEIENR